MSVTVVSRAKLTNARARWVIALAAALAASCTSASPPPSSGPIREAPSARPSAPPETPEAPAPAASADAQAPLESPEEPPSSEGLTLWMPADTFGMGNFIAADGDEVYWAQILVQPKGGAIFAKNKHEGTTREVWRGDVFPWQLEIAEGTLVFSRQVSGAPMGRVMATPTRGGSMRILASQLEGPASIAADGSTCFYLTDAGELHAVPLAGGADRVLSSGTKRRTSLAVDATNLYWVQGDTEIWDMPKTGGAPRHLARGRGIGALSVDSGFVYFTEEQTRTISRVAVSGGAVQEIAQDPLVPGPLALDASHVYWASAEPSINTISRAPRQGGDRELVVRGELIAADLLVDARHVYLTRLGSEIGVARVGKAHHP